MKTKIISIRVPEEISNFWKNNNSFREDVIGYIKKQYDLLNKKIVKKIIYYLDGAFKEKDSITAFEIYNAMPSSLDNIIDAMTVYSHTHEDIVLEMPDPDTMEQMPLTKSLSLVRLIIKVK